MKILIVGNHTCGNRGDAAILRGLLDGLSLIAPSAQVTTTSRYPISSAFLLERPFLPDVMQKWYFRSFWRYTPRRFKRVCIPLLMTLAIRPSRRWILHLLPMPIRERINWLQTYDVVIQCGGSFFVDLYGLRQLETPLAALLADRRFVMIGHSIGPFNGFLYRKAISTLLDAAAAITLRESVSKQLVIDAGLPIRRIQPGSDTAWLVEPRKSIANTPPALPPTNGRPTVAITLRDLAPFGSRLRVSQEAYEAAFVKLADSLLERGYDIVACSTCTGIESYHRDDRIPALRIKSRVTQPDRFHVLMNEFNDFELGQIFSGCRLTIGTRLHSAIISMNFGTPAIALNYEHKSEGIMAQLGLPELAIALDALLDGRLTTLAWTLLSDEGLADRVKAAVARERENAFSMLQDVLRRVGVGESAWVADPATPAR